MPTVISINTSSKIGIWNISQRGQSFINNYYAITNGYKVTQVLSVSLFYNLFNNLRSILEVENKKKDVNIIFCSTLQLLNLKKEKKDFINFFKKYNIHFALELKKGKGVKYLNEVFDELDRFTKKKNISFDKAKSYKALFKQYKNKII